MPILPEIEEKPSRIEQLREAGIRAGAFITGNAPITVRLVLLLVMAVVASSMAPVPWAQIGVLAVVGIAVETVARRRNT